MTDTPPETLYCANHPGRETSLRCNNCEKPICPECAVLTPTGYRCKECVRGQQKVFNTASGIDYPLAFIVAAVLGYIGSLAAQFVGFFVLLVAPFVGVIVAEAVRFVIRRHRSRGLYNTALAGMILGCLPAILFPLLATTLGLVSGAGLTSLLGSASVIWQVIYAGLAVSSMYYRLSGIQLGRRS
jgi:hypothetical protein